MEEEVLKSRVKQGDPEAEYDLAFFYYQRGKYQETVKCFEEIICKPNHPRYRQSVNNLAEICEYDKYPGRSEEKNLDEAVRLFNIAIASWFAKFHLSLIYSENKYDKYNPIEGKKMLDDALTKLVHDDGNDNYLRQIECLRIGKIYRNVNDIRRAKDYLQKAMDRCNTNYADERSIKEEAKRILQEISF